MRRSHFAFLFSTFVFLQGAYAFDLNSASAFELESLPAIGQKMAQKIVTERQRNGGFKSWQDFQIRVNGIGDKNLKKMQDAGLILSDALTQKTSEPQ